jgi:23S rRNA pseudouridine2605 synthase
MPARPSTRRNRPAKRAAKGAAKRPAKAAAKRPIKGAIKRPVKAAAKRPATRRSTSTSTTTTGERLQKVLAAAGIDSRRQCEELILAGRVEVDGKAVTKLGTRVDPTKHEIRVDGTPLPKPRLVYYMLNKPPGVLSTNRDPSGRSRVIDLIDGDHSHLFPVGRLDASSEGLILVTNDGELANLLTHPRYGIEKTYQVQVAGSMGQGDLVKLRRGMYLAEAKARPVRVRITSRHKQSTLLEMVLDEGRNREIRRLLARLDHKVMKLRRVAIGPLKLGKLLPGESRRLKRDEVRALRQAAEDQPATSARPPRKKITTARNPPATKPPANKSTAKKSTAKKRPARKITSAKNRKRTGKGQSADKGRRRR